MTAVGAGVCDASADGIAMSSAARARRERVSSSHELSPFSVGRRTGRRRETAVRPSSDRAIATSWTGSLRRYTSPGRGRRGRAASRRRRRRRQPPVARRTAKATLTALRRWRRHAQPDELGQVVGRDLQHRPRGRGDGQLARRRGEARRRARGTVSASAPLASLVAGRRAEQRRPRRRRASPSAPTRAPPTSPALKAATYSRRAAASIRLDREHAAASRAGRSSRRSRAPGCCVAQRGERAQVARDRDVGRRRTTSRCRSAARRRAPRSASRRPASGTCPAAPPCRRRVPAIPTSSP